VIQQGQEATGLQFKRNRYYNAERGAFTQEDPIGLAGGANLYGFANGDPVNLADPFGLQACSPREPHQCPSFSGTAARGVIRETSARLAAVQPLMQAAASLALLAPMGGGESAITTLGVGKTLTFFRGVSAAEAADVTTTGALRAGVAAAGNTGKYLTNTVAAAVEWGAKHGPGSQVLRVRVAADATRTFTRLGRIDAIGEAWWAPIESLKGAKVDVVGSTVRTTVPR
jgi:RHS repeat-associated protein